jgi:hypothetical protein
MTHQKIQQRYLMTLNKEFMYANWNINIETGALDEAAETRAKLMPIKDETKTDSTNILTSPVYKFSSFISIKKIIEFFIFPI